MTLVGGLHVEMDFLLNRCILIILEKAPHQNDGKVASACLLKTLIGHDTLKQFYFYSITFSLLKNQGFVKPYSQIKIWNTNTFPRFTLNIEGKIY
jgi:hypothetical protein